MDPALASLGLVKGDLDGDGEVGFSDFLDLSTAFGSNSESLGYADGDIDCNGEVDSADFLVLSGNFGEKSQAASVPEPNMQYAWLVIIGLIHLRHKRPR